MRWLVLPLLILVTACAGSGTQNSSKREPLVLPGAGGSQSDRSASSGGLIHHVCSKRSDIPGCLAAKSFGYVCKDMNADAGAAAPAGAPALALEQAQADCAGDGAMAPQGESIICCTDLGPEFAY